MSENGCPSGTWTLELPSGLALSLRELKSGQRFCNWAEQPSKVPADSGDYRFYALRDGRRTVAYLSLADDLYDAQMMDEIEDEDVDGPYFHGDGPLLYLESVWVDPSWRRQGVCKALCAWLASFGRPVFTYFENDELRDYFEREHKANGPSFSGRVATGIDRSAWSD